MKIESDELQGEFGKWCHHKILAKFKSERVIGQRQSRYIAIGHTLNSGFESESSLVQIGLKNGKQPREDASQQCGGSARGLPSHIQQSAT